MSIVCRGCKAADYPDKVRNLGPLRLRMHLLAFQSPYSKHWSDCRQVCRTCSTIPV